MSGWTDAHCHLQGGFGPDGTTEVAADDALAHALAAGVDRVVVVGTNDQTSRDALDLAARGFVGVEIFSTIGLHPHEATDGVGPVVALARERGAGAVAIGECGLDYFYEHSPREVQRQVFAAQIGLAHELDLALVVHARDAWEDLYAVLASEGVPARTVIHCFTGGPGEAEACLALGCDISISGIVTFKTADSVRAAARATPLDRLHVETDSPFLAPVPFRGRPNEPAHVATVGAAVAVERGCELADLRAATRANSARLFGLP